MPLTLPPPPKSRGVVGLIVTLLFVGWTGYLLVTYDQKKPDVIVVRGTPALSLGPVFVEIDLRGPKYDAGRYEGYQKGREARSKGFTLPAENVLTFQATEEAKSKSVVVSETEDFTDGYAAGFKLAMTEAKTAAPEITPIAPQK